MDQRVAWEETHKTKAWDSNPNNDFLAFMAKYYWGHTGLEFLDLGAGAGASALFLASKGFKVKAVEFSKSACDKLRYNLPESDKLLVQVINADVNEVNFEQSTVDCIVAVRIFECLGLEESCLLIKKAKDWLKPNGRLFASILAQDLPEELRHTGVELRSYSLEEVMNMFSDYSAGVGPITQYVTGKCIPVSNWIVSASNIQFK